MQLVLPSEQYKNSFLEALEEYHQTKSNDRLDIYELSVLNLQSNFSQYIKGLQEKSEGKHLPKGYVPQTDYWLVEGNDLIGRVSLRHSLTPHLLREGGHIGYDIRPSKRRMGYGKKLLALALPKAKELGLEKVLITCDETNIGSKKIIESNGGIFENSVEMAEGKPRKLRYWITLANIPTS